MYSARRAPLGLGYLLALPLRAVVLFVQGNVPVDRARPFGINRVEQSGECTRADLHAARPGRRQLPAAFRSDHRRIRHELDATAAEADRLSSEYPPAEALRRWAQSLARFVATKRGFASALHSGDPAYQPLPAQFLGVLAPRVQSILDAGQADGTIRGDVRAEDLIHALSGLADSHPGESEGRAARMTGVLLDGVDRGGPAAARLVGNDHDALDQVAAQCEAERADAVESLPGHLQVHEVGLGLALLDDVDELEA